MILRDRDHRHFDQKPSINSWSKNSNFALKCRHMLHKRTTSPEFFKRLHATYSREAMLIAVIYAELKEGIP
jgi:hypothetical protein